MKKNLLKHYSDFLLLNLVILFFIFNRLNLLPSLLFRQDSVIYEVIFAYIFSFLLLLIYLLFTKKLYYIRSFKKFFYFFILLLLFEVIFGTGKSATLLLVDIVITSLIAMQLKYYDHNFRKVFLIYIVLILFSFVFIFYSPNPSTCSECASIYNRLEARQGQFFQFALFFYNPEIDGVSTSFISQEPNQFFLILFFALFIFYSLSDKRDNIKFPLLSEIIIIIAMLASFLSGATWALLFISLGVSSYIFFTSHFFKKFAVLLFFGGLGFYLYYNFGYYIINWINNKSGLTTINAWSLFSSFSITGDSILASALTENPTSSNVLYILLIFFLFIYIFLQNYKYNFSIISNVYFFILLGFFLKDPLHFIFLDKALFLTTYILHMVRYKNKYETYYVT